MIQTNEIKISKNVKCQKCRLKHSTGMTFCYLVQTRTQAGHKDYL